MKSAHTSVVVGRSMSGPPSPVGQLTVTILSSGATLPARTFDVNTSLWLVKISALTSLKLDPTKVNAYSLIVDGKSLPDKKTLKEVGLRNNAMVLLSPSTPHGMVLKAIISAILAPVAVLLLLYLNYTKASVLGVTQETPLYLIGTSLVGVLIYIAIIAATKVQDGSYQPLTYVPEYMLRFAEAPVFMVIIYALILQNNTTLAAPGLLLTISLFIGLFTRDFEEFLKTIGKSVLKAFEDYYSSIKI